MKAILVRYLPPTDRKPSRLRVSAEGVKSVTVRAYRVVEDFAVQALLDQNPQWGWTLDDLVKGRLPNGDLVYVYKRKRLPLGFAVRGVQS